MDAAPKILSLDNLNSIGFDSVNLALQKCFSTDQVLLQSFHISPASEELLGFQGQHLKLKIDCTIRGIQSKIVLFIKSMQKNNQASKDFNDDFRLFEREASMYNNIFSQFHEEDDTTAWHAKCFLAQSEDLIFEDLNEKGFKMLDIRECLDYEHCLTVLTSLARFHAASLVLEEKKTELHNHKYRLNDDFKKDLNGSLFNYNKWFKIARETALSVAGESKIYGKNTIHFKSVQASWDETMKKGIEMSAPSEEIRNVVCHSDLWNNNMMFRYDSNNKPVQCIFVDFQVCSYSSPALDVMSFLCLTMHKYMRDNRMEIFLKHYHGKIDDTLRAHGFNVHEILPWKIFRKSCNDYYMWGLMQSVICFQYLFLDKTVALKIIQSSDDLLKLHYETREVLMLKMLKDDSVFAERMMSNMDDYIRLYVLRNQ